MEECGVQGGVTDHVHDSQDVVLDVLVLIVAHHVRVDNHKRFHVLLARNGAFLAPIASPSFLCFTSHPFLSFLALSVSFPAFSLSDDVFEVVCKNRKL